jgi:hypothetical protein
LSRNALARRSSRAARSVLCLTPGFKGCVIRRCKRRASAMSSGTLSLDPDLRRASRGSQRRPAFVVSRNQPGKHWTAARVPIGLGATSVCAHIASESVPDRKNLDIIPAPNLSCYIVAHSDQDQLQLDRKDD